MEFSVEFYETGSGRCPVREFLDELKKSNMDDFAAVMAGLAKLRSRHYHRPPLSKPIGNDLFELRHVGKLNTRVLYFFVKGRRIIAVHGIRKKAIKIAARDRKVALDRKCDWLARNPI
ncbi:MAG: type II toxin-antitoxin system RelE/ParE family toxin [Desulfobacterales bacterium]|nr:type II toxin-antitoxin system RelE/ParE family toxin [Desulfobacterales bacterium]